jgi:hypothetical protein
MTAQQKPRPRTNNSVRFDPYFKLEFWNPRAVAWTPMQRRFEKQTDALAAVKRGKYRIMTVTEAGIETGKEQTK